MSIETIGEFGVAGVLIVLVYKLLELVVTLFKGEKKAPLLTMTPLACQTDPKHFQRNMETHGMVKKVLGWTDDIKESVNQGEFSCAWQGRDEIRDFRESISALGQSGEALVVEMRLLREEMVKTRNGK